MRIRWWLQTAGAAAALLMPPAAVALLLPANRTWIRLGRGREWLYVWAPLLLLGAWRLANADDGWWLLGTALVGTLYSLVIVPVGARPVVQGLVASMLVFLAVALVGTAVERSAWRSYSYPRNELRAALDQLRGTDTLAGREGGASFGKLWEVPAGTDEVTIAFDLRSAASGGSAPGATPITATFARGGQATQRSESFAAVATPEWRRHRWEIPLVPADGPTRRTLVLRVEEGRAVEVRALEVASGPSGGVRRIPFEPRAELWFTDPNLAGHSVALAGLTALSLSGSPLLSVVSLAVSAAGVVLTGSRAALAALAGAGLALVLLRSRRRALGWALLLTVVLAVGAFVALRPETLGMLERGTLDVNSVPRQEIWGFALRMGNERPWTGWGTDGFAERWSQVEPAALTRVTHAHDLLLEFYAAYGVPGALAALAVALALLRVAWVRRGREGIVIWAAAAWLNLVDYTLFSSAVVALLALAFNTGPDAGPVAGGNAPEGATAPGLE